VILLNYDAFAAPATGVVGNSPRNGFHGPGFYSLDLSLSRSFRMPWLGEAGRLRFRADAFNFLNHANLNNPSASLSAGRAGFGLASYGRREGDAAFPTLVPFTETGRQIQFLLRIEF
jgi:hypothetical protein